MVKNMLTKIFWGFTEKSEDEVSFRIVGLLVE